MHKRRIIMQVFFILPADMVILLIKNFTFGQNRYMIWIVPGHADA